MSMLSKINLNLTKNSSQIIKNGAALMLASSFCSRRDSKNTTSPYKVVKSKVKVEDSSGWLGAEAGPNWELLSPKGNRFYLPNSCGPAWQNATTTLQTTTALEQLVDFDCNEESKLQITTKSCPVVIRKSLHELFPAPEVQSGANLSLITLTSSYDMEEGAKQFVLAAKEICSRLRMNGWWSDFINPFSGKPFYSYASSKTLYTIDYRSRGIGMKLENLNDCLLITECDQEFSGNVFTNFPSDLPMLQSLIMD